MYNREKVVDIITEGICRSEEYASNYLLSFDGAREVANSVVDFMAEVGFLNFDKNTGAITEAAHFANTDVGRSAASDDTSTKESLQAASGETRLVGQNEQTEKVCPKCGGIGWYWAADWIGNLQGRKDCGCGGKPKDASAARPL